MLNTVRLFVSLIALFASAEAFAFCVYNETPFGLKVRQMGGETTFKGMSTRIDPWEKACCNWKNKDCNKKRERDNMLRFQISPDFKKARTYDPEKKKVHNLYCGKPDDKKDNYRLVKAPAGSAIVVQWYGPVDRKDEYHGTYVDLNWFHVWAWNLDNEGIYSSNACYPDEKKWSPSDLF